MKHILLTAFLALCAIPATWAQGTATHETLTTDASKAPYVEPALNVLNVGFEGGEDFVGVMANTDYDITTDPDAPWLTAKTTDGGILVKTEYSYLIDPRTASLKITSNDGSCQRTLEVVQGNNNSAMYIQGDNYLTIKSATADQSQQGQGIKNTYDRNTSTIWHSPYSTGTTSFPINLEYTHSGS